MLGRVVKFSPEQPDPGDSLRSVQHAAFTWHGWIAPMGGPTRPYLIAHARNTRRI